MKNPLILPYLILLGLLTFVVFSTQAQVQAQIVYKRTVTLGQGDHFYFDTLKFSNNKLLYIENHKMDQWWTEQKWRITIHPEDRKRYINMNTQELVDQQFNFDKKHYELKKAKEAPFEWTLLNEFKKIGKYKVQKATTHQIAFDGEKLEVTAWFTPEIPIGVGPDAIWGLPGLIIEMRIAGQLAGGYALESINYNPVSITIPNKGVLVSEEKVQSTAKLNKLMTKN